MEASWNNSNHSDMIHLIRNVTDLVGRNVFDEEDQESSRILRFILK